jgi:YbbR domain-containing protein
MARLTPSWDPQRLLAPLRRNVPAKLFALVFAFVLWLFVNAGKRETQVVQFPVELKNFPERTVLVGRERIDTVAVRLNGPSALLASLDGRRAPIVLDVSGIEPGREVRLKVRDEMIRVPRGVRILDVEPERVALRLEEIRTAVLPVRVVRSGEVGNGYRVESVKATPGNVEVTGPTSTLAALTVVETEPLDLGGLTASTQRPLALVRGEQTLAITPERVIAHIEVEAVTIARELKRVPVEVRNVDHPFQLRPQHVKLTVRGPERTVQGLELEAGSVYVDGAALGVGEHSVEAEVALPPGVELVKREPAALNLQILERKNGARR